MQIKQFRNNGCLSYILFDESTKQAIVIDPSISIEEYESHIQENGLQLVYILDTHTHADHESGARILAEKYKNDTDKQKNKNHIPEIVMSSKHDEQLKVDPTALQDELMLNTIMKNYAITIDKKLADTEELVIGNMKIKALHTPGHTKDSMSLLVNNQFLFTGDLLLINQVGKTDLPGGNAEQMYKTFKEKILSLPDSTIIYPCHDYEGRENSTLLQQKTQNIFLQQQRMIDFVKRIKESVEETAENRAAGKTCGSGNSSSKDGSTQIKSQQENQSILMRSKKQNTFYEEMFKIILQKFTMQIPKEFMITPDELVEELQNNDKIFLLDVRNPEELEQYGQIGDAVNIPLPELVNRLHELPEDNDTKIIIYCQSGMRSAIAVYFLKEAFSYISVRTVDGGFNGFSHA